MIKSELKLNTFLAHDCFLKDKVCQSFSLNLRLHFTIELSVSAVKRHCPR